MQRVTHGFVTALNVAFAAAFQAVVIERRQADRAGDGTTREGTEFRQKNGTLVLQDVSSSYMEGRCCPLAKRGYSRDGRQGSLQIVYGLLCAPDGCPVAIEVFEGNTGDPMTLANQVEKLKRRFGLDRVVLVVRLQLTG
jgi:hypothetical protein